MSAALLQRFSGASLGARALRSSLLTVSSFGFSQALRLGGNLILTRLLFPEAFGLMALVSVFLMGLMQFSDVGVGPAILQSKRGDDPDFLDTAWTIQILRGAGLCLFACVLAGPMAAFYDEPQLRYLLPVQSLSLLIIGFRPTRMDTAARHLLLGRVTQIELLTQTVSVVGSVLLAWVMGSVWALVLAGLINSVVEVIANSLLLPGKRNRFRMEAEARHELVHFGKWIFLSTVCGFFFSQGDKILIGKYLSIDAFGVYNIGYFLASFPMLLGGVVTRKVLIPIYRESPPRESRQNFLRLRKMRFLVTGPLLVLVACFAVSGHWLVELMYDDRYLAAGAVTVIIACMQMPQVIVQTYDQAALAAGDSRSFFVLALARAVLMVCCILIGLESFGLIGALLGYGAAFVLAYPVVVWLARRMGVWDPLHDLCFAGLGAALAVLSVLLNWPAIMGLVALGG